MPATPNEAKRTLGALLVGLREGAGLYAADTARHLGVTPTTVGRYEAGTTVPQDEDLETILNLYGATEDQRSAVHAALLDARAGVVRLQHASAVSPKFRSFLRAEADAEGVRTYAPLAVPGLLQTPAYASTVQQKGRAVTDPAVPVDRIVAARMSRQQRLSLDVVPLQLHALLDEIVVLRCAAEGKLGDDQLVHLLQAGAQKNITIQVVPTSAGLYGAMSSPVTRFQYPGKGDTAAVYLEYPGGGAWVRGKGVGKYEQLLDDIQRCALGHDESLTLIAAARRT
jgi:transcriptional regulator with XRE-family HTH domain